MYYSTKENQRCTHLQKKSDSELKVHCQQGAVLLQSHGCLLNYIPTFMTETFHSIIKAYLSVKTTEINIHLKHPKIRLKVIWFPRHPQKKLHFIQII